MSKSLVHVSRVQIRVAVFTGGLAVHAALLCAHRQVSSAALQVSAQLPHLAVVHHADLLPFRAGLRCIDEISMTREERAQFCGGRGWGILVVVAGEV